MATAGLVAAGVVLVPFLFVDRGPNSTGIATDPSSPSATASATGDGLRTESWHHVTFEVPDDWGFGNPSAYCAGGGTPQDATPTVGRPSDIAPAIACDPQSGYGVTAGPAALYEPASEDVFQYSAKGVDLPRYPDGTWLSIWYDDDVAVTVATPDRALTEQIVTSVHLIDGADANGCAPTAGEAEAGLSDGTDSTSLCRYDAEDGLEWSRRLTVEDARQLLDAVQAAPMRTDAGQCGADRDPVARTVLLTGGSYTATVVTDASCEADNGVFLSGVVRELTDEVRAVLERPSPAG